MTVWYLPVLGIPVLHGHEEKERLTVFMLSDMNCIYVYLLSNPHIHPQPKYNIATYQQDWSPSSDGGYDISTATSHTGASSIKVTNGGATQTVTLPAGSGASGSTITFGGYSRAVGTGTNLFHDYSIMADVTFTDGTEQFGEAATFQGGTTDGVGWVLETRSFAVPEDKTVQSIDLSVLYRNDPTPNGVVYFDDVFVHVDNESGALSNPGFEGDDLRSTGWKSYMGGYAVDTATSHSGGQSIKVKSGGASQWIYPSNAVEGSTMKFSGYAKSEGASSIQGGPAVMSVYVDVKYWDGSWLLGQEAEFAGGRTEGWEYAENTIPLAKDAEAIHVRAVYYGDVQGGTAWFDDFNVQIG